MARQSSIDKLPKELRDLLNQLLRNPAVSQLDAAQKINDLLEAQGKEPVSKSAVNRYSQRIEKVGEKMRQSREVAEMLLPTLGETGGNEVSKLITEQLRTLIFDLVLKFGEGETEDIDPKAIKELSRSVINLEQASSLNEKRVTAIKKQAREEAAEEAASEAKSQGLTAEGARAIKNKILGIS